MARSDRATGHDRATWHGVAVPRGVGTARLGCFPWPISVLARLARASGHDRATPVPRRDLKVLSGLFQGEAVFIQFFYSQNALRRFLGFNTIFHTFGLRF